MIKSLFFLCLCISSTSFAAGPETTITNYDIVSPEGILANVELIEAPNDPQGRKLAARAASDFLKAQKKSVHLTATQLVQEGQDTSYFDRFASFYIQRDRREWEYVHQKIHPAAGMPTLSEAAPPDRSERLFYAFVRFGLGTAGASLVLYTGYGNQFFPHIFVMTAAAAVAGALSGILQYEDALYSEWLTCKTVFSWVVDRSLDRDGPIVDFVRRSREAHSQLDRRLKELEQKLGPKFASQLRKGLEESALLLDNQSFGFLLEASFLVSIGIAQNLLIGQYVDLPITIWHPAEFLWHIIAPSLGASAIGSVGQSMFDQAGSYLEKREKENYKAIVPVDSEIYVIHQAKATRFKRRLMVASSAVAVGLALGSARGSTLANWLLTMYTVGGIGFRIWEGTRKAKIAPPGLEINPFNTLTEFGIPDTAVCQDIF